MLYYNDLLPELSKTKILLKDKSMHEEEFDATLSCKQCDSKFTNEQNLIIPIKSDHKVKCKLCKLILNINKRLQKTYRTLQWGGSYCH